MHRYIALLRGINVGGHKKILMADLRLLFESLGFTEVLTYIQSGNVVFSTSSEGDSAETISEAIKIEYGWDVPVLVKTGVEIRQILDGCPFPKEKKEKSYFTLLQQPPLKSNVEIAQSYSFQDEEFIITPQCVYFYCIHGYGKIKMPGNFLESKLKVKTTTRNYRTMTKLVAM